MMKKAHSSWLIALSLILMAQAVCFAQAISSTDLINRAQEYDGKIVTYEGEVIGDVMHRQDYAWVNVNDGENAVGIWISNILAKDIFYSGSYKAKGDRIEITGVFHRACLQHGGDLDIHAEAIRKISPGKPLTEKISPAKKTQAAILLGALILLWILTLFPRK